MSCLLCRGLFSCGPAVRVHDNDAWVQRCCSVGRMMCAQLPLDSQVWPSLAIVELSTTETFVACMSCLRSRGLFSCGAAVHVHDNDARVQQSCSARHRLCAQLRCRSAAAAALAIAESSTTEYLFGRTHKLFAGCFAAGCFAAGLRCMNVIKMCGCSNAVQRGAGSLHWSAAAAALAIAGLHDGAAEKQQPVRFVALQRAQRLQPVC